MKQLAFLILFFGFVFQIEAQWFSIELGLGNGGGKSVEDLTGFRFENIERNIMGLDTFYIDKIYDTELLQQRRVDDVGSADLAIKYNIPLNENWTLNGGLGVRLQSFRYTNSTEVLNSDLVLSDTLESYVSSPGEFDPISGFLSCDSITNVFFGDRNNYTHNILGNVNIPLSLSRIIVKNKLQVNFGLNLNFPFKRRQRHRYNELRLRTTESNGNLSICEYSSATQTSTINNSLTNLSIEGIIGLQAKVLERTWMNFSYIRNYVSLTNPDASGMYSHRYVVPFNFRPWYLRVGISFDLVRYENLENRRTNYLLEKAEKEF